MKRINIFPNVKTNLSPDSLVNCMVGGFLALSKVIKTADKQPNRNRYHLSTFKPSEVDNIDVDEPETTLLKFLDV